MSRALLSIKLAFSAALLILVVAGSGAAAQATVCEDQCLAVESCDLYACRVKVSSGTDLVTNCYYDCGDVNCNLDFYSGDVTCGTPY